MQGSKKPAYAGMVGAGFGVIFLWKMRIYAKTSIK
jgi:hypothetical protein